MKKLLTSVVSALAIVVLAGSQAFALTGSPYTSATTGLDVSYTNCSASIPTGKAFGIVGVSGGLVYSNNSCAAAEASHFVNPSLYVNTGLNASQSSQYYVAAESTCASGDVMCAAYHYGYNAAQHAVNYAQSQGLALSNPWWLDVETGNTWNSDTAQNDQALQGEHDAIVALTPAGTQVGVYSTNYQWSTIAGSFKPSWPVWYATGSRKLNTSYCSASYGFTAGQVQLIQWKGTLDNDYAC